MAPRRKSPLSALPSATSPAGVSSAREAGARWMPSLEPTCALPAPEHWPLPLKRLVVATVTRRGLTWDQWCIPWRQNAQPSREAAWCALRTAAALLTASNRLITNDEAWTICMNDLARSACVVDTHAAA